MNIRLPKLEIPNFSVGQTEYSGFIACSKVPMNVYIVNDVIKLFSLTEKMFSWRSTKKVLAMVLREESYRKPKVIES